MNDDIYKGQEIARFPGIWANNKRKERIMTYYPYVCFIPAPIVAITLFLMPTLTPEGRDLVLLTTMPMMILFSLASFLLIDWRFTSIRSPVIVYTNGIEHWNGLVSKMMGRKDFIHKASIQRIEVSERTFSSSNGIAKSCTIRIGTNDGRVKVIGPRGTNRLKGFTEATSKMGVEAYERRTN